MERNFGAMTLACHIFRFEKSRWPASLDELLPYLPAAPKDAWGAMGYALVKGGLPDGSDRPLIYSHYQSKDGMLYRIDGPQYSLYQSDGTDRPAKEQQEGGQFRDLALWAPPRNKTGPTLRSLE